MHSPSLASIDRAFSATSPVRMSPRTPLGITIPHNHYIRPVPPTYVTEYESAYTWPPSYAYSPAPSTYSRFSPEKGRKVYEKKSTGKTSRWEALEASLDNLMADKADLPQPEITKDRIVQRKLDANIERLYDQFKEVLNNSSNKNISAQRRKMYQEFVKLVEEMRQL